MKTFNSIFAAMILLGGASLVACGDDSGSGGAGGDAATSGSTSTVTSGGPTSTSSSSKASSSASTGGDGGQGGEGPGPGPGTGGAGGGTGGAGGQPDPFVFSDAAYDDYTRQDRHGAVEAGTVGILAESGLGIGTHADDDLSRRDEYNAANPVDDSAGDFQVDLLTSVGFLHGQFDDDIEALDLTPANTADVIAQALPVIVPDAIKYDPEQETSYPNGRALTDQVVDISLAAVLVKLGGKAAVPLTVFADLPLNPPANDEEFSDTFPFLADPH